MDKTASEWRLFFKYHLALSSSDRPNTQTRASCGVCSGICYHLESLCFQHEADLWRIASFQLKIYSVTTLEDMLNFCCSVPCSPLPPLHIGLFDLSKYFGSINQKLYKIKQASELPIDPNDECECRVLIRALFLKYFLP